ncbi:hypothetical protein CW354_02015 [Marinicaulis flavus]|uniref:Uncharacterized protein n=1 Tax=Hyphococcus luteus TaxID=2058213 RepID=A0A2S7KAX4_9PROT|nr:hypothetical protein CW354_02015 [Marinicaulis flavus]
MAAQFFQVLLGFIIEGGGLTDEVFFERFCWGGESVETAYCGVGKIPESVSIRNKSHDCDYKLSLRPFIVNLRAKREPAQANFKFVFTACRKIVDIRFMEKVVPVRPDFLHDAIHGAIQDDGCTSMDFSSHSATPVTDRKLNGRPITPICASHTNFTLQQNKRSPRHLFRYECSGFRGARLSSGNAIQTNGSDHQDETEKGAKDRRECERLTPPWPFFIYAAGFIIAAYGSGSLLDSRKRVLRYAAVGLICVGAIMTFGSLYIIIDRYF